MHLRNRDSKVDLLDRQPLFKGLDRRSLNLVARHADQVKVDAGTVIGKEGRLAREFLLVVAGSVRVEKDAAVIGRLGSGRFFGEIALIEGTPQTATVIAETLAVLLVVEARSFSYLLTAVPELQRRLLVNLCHRLREAEGALHASAGQTASWPLPGATRLPFPAQP